MAGQFVHAVGFLLEDGSMMARFIHVHGENQDPGHHASVFGHVTALGDAVFWVNEHVVVEYNLENAEYIGWNGEPADSGAVQVGSFVHVTGDRLEVAMVGDDIIIRPMRVRVLPGIIMAYDPGYSSPTCPSLLPTPRILSHGKQSIMPSSVGVPITGPNGEDLTAEDLMLGDAFLATVEYIAEDPENCFEAPYFLVSALQVVARPTLDGAAGDFAATVNVVQANRPTLRVPEGGADAFGYVSLPDRAPPGGREHRLRGSRPRLVQRDQRLRRSDPAPPRQPARLREGRRFGHQSGQRSQRRSDGRRLRVSVPLRPDGRSSPLHGRRGAVVPVARHG
jgi:hypothetical protein